MERTKKIGVVITTISDGNFLKKFTSSLNSRSLKGDVVFYIIGDVNTPKDCEINCNKINSEFFNCKYLSVGEQELFLDKLNFPKSFIPLKSDNRRNVGYLKAVEEECDLIVSMDDDNFPYSDDFFDLHSVVGDKITGPITTTSNNWFNPFTFLGAQDPKGNDLNLYPRGFPYSRRWDDYSDITSIKKQEGKVAVNVGLWLGDPDVDAITRLTTNCVTFNKRNKNNLVLGHNQLMPINTQNTAISKEAIECYYFIKMGYQIDGSKMDRFGDIFSGYFLLLCTHSVGDLVTINNPLVFQDRNEHNLLNDLAVEFPGIKIIEDLVPFFEEGLPSTGSYSEAYSVLIEKLESYANNNKSKFWNTKNLIFINEITGIMKAWQKAYTNIKN
ncbi:hypothetical protein [Zobellia nedashkovskayae]|uniref:hypothetical protein n=1 Tax=Zobellia nedashkovskayae TaxID=2779510 RepID=UPI00188D985E|nr:hypothetical protein [Zobellia nedashkovskayae]